jgi:hypothetical protein
LNSAKIILIYLLGFCSSCSYASDADEDITRALIVVRLTNYIEWGAQDDPAHAKPSDKFNLCVYDSRQTTRIFKKHLKTLKINNLPINTENIVEIEDVSGCDALYLKKPGQHVVDWLVAHNTENKILMVAEGQGYAELGIHLNLFLNERGSFDLALNADAFEISSHNINSDLLALGQVVSQQIISQSKLLNSLINYTHWPVKKIIYNENSKFQMCATKNDAFATFTQYYLSQKPLNGKKSQLKIIEPDAFPESCQLIFVSGNPNQLQTLMKNRNKLSALLVGHNQGLGESGTHYNLLSDKNKQGRRFEVNLLALKSTGHKPDIQLLNSATVVKNDYPSIIDILSQIALLTKKSASVMRQQDVVNLCVFQEQNLYKNLKQLLVKKVSRYPKIIPIELIDVNNKNICDIVFIGKQLDLFNTLKIVKPLYPEALLVSSQTINQENNSMPVHFNLLIKPNEVSYESFSKNLSMSGFTFKNEIIGANKSGGNSND